MGIEQGMVGDVPELGLVVGAIPDRGRAFGNRLFEHFESGLILGNDDLGVIHLILSSPVRFYFRSGSAERGHQARALGMPLPLGNGKLLGLPPLIGLAERAADQHADPLD